MNKKLLTLAVAGAISASASQAADIQFSGFASIVGGLTTSSDESLYGYDDKIDFTNGSLFALQASSDLGEGLSATVQISANGEDNWEPEFKWAYLGYDVSDDLRILAGRQITPFYMYSDYIDVSYAYSWISPPVGVYDLTFDTFDGLGAIYNTNFGDVDASFHGVFGKNSDEITVGDTKADIDVDNLMGLASTFTYDWLTLRASYFVADITLPLEDLDDLAAGWEAYGYSDIADNVSVYEDTSTFMGFGFQMNFDALSFVGEYTDLDIEDTTFADEQSFYVTAAYQLDSVLLHVTYGEDEDTISSLTSDVSYGTDATLNTIKGTTDFITDDQKEDTSYVTLGARYDFHDSAALKFEYTDFSDDRDSTADTGLFRVALVTVF